MVVSSAANSSTFTVTTPSDQEIRMTRLFDAPRAPRVRGDDEAGAREASGGDDSARATRCRSARSTCASAAGGASSTGTRRARSPFTASTGRSPRRAGSCSPRSSRSSRTASSVVTTDFTEEGGKTRMTATVRYPSKEVRDMVIASGMSTGAGISYDRLEDLVAELQRAK